MVATLQFFDTFAQNIGRNKNFQLIVRPFLLVFNWRGRATRREVIATFFMLPLFMVPEILFSGFDETGISWFLINWFLWLAVFISTAIRRMHDISRRGWALAIIGIPYVGVFIFAIFLFLAPDNDANPFGIDPRSYFDGDMK